MTVDREPQTLEEWRTAYFIILKEVQRLRRVEEALKDLLKYAERVHGGDRTLTSEEYYIVRDYARNTLANPAAPPVPSKPAEPTISS